MSRFWVFALGLLTLWPIVNFVLVAMWVIFMLLWSVLAESAGADDEAFFLLSFAFVFVVQIVTTLLILVLVAVYVVHLFTTDRVPQEKKALWAVVLLAANAFAMPAYWYIYIRPRDTSPQAPP